MFDNRPFKRETIQGMVKHLNLPDKVRKTMMEFTIDDEFTFLMSIKQNHGKNGAGLFRLIEEIIVVSIEGGSYDARSHQLVIEVAEILGVPRDLVELHCESIYDLLRNSGKKKTKDANELDEDYEDENENDEEFIVIEEGNDCDGKNINSEDVDNKSTNNYENNRIDTGNKLIKRKKRKEEKEKTKIKKKKTLDEATMRKVRKYMIVGLASLGGAAVMGVTGGLAAPVVASALAGVVGGSLALSATAAGVVGSLFGVAGAGLTASKMNKRIGDLEEFSFLSMNPAYDQTSLTITIAISGWISEDNERGFIRPWRRLRHTREQYCLCYESKYLLELSQAMDYLLSLFFSYAAQQALTYTFLASVMAAIAWPAALMSMANIIDNPWDVCINRSTKAGKRLAEVLRSRQQGNRPVTLIGFSLGARVIFYCLQELAQHNDTLGLIGDVIVLGAPVTACEDQWKSIGKVVNGKIINGYSSSDWLLKFLYRTSNAALKIAGLQEIPWQDRKLRNVNLTALVGGHLDYYKKINEILQFINIKTAEPDDLSLLDDDLTLSLDATTGDNYNNKCTKAKWDAAFVDPLAATASATATIKSSHVVSSDQIISHSIDQQAKRLELFKLNNDITTATTSSAKSNTLKSKRFLRRARSLNWRHNGNGHLQFDKTQRNQQFSGTKITNNAANNGSIQNKQFNKTDTFGKLTHGPIAHNTWLFKRRFASCWSLESI